MNDPLLDRLAAALATRRPSESREDHQARVIAAILRALHTHDAAWALRLLDQVVQIWLARSDTRPPTIH